MLLSMHSWAVCVCVCEPSHIAKGESRVQFHSWVLWLCLLIQAMKVMRPNSFSCTMFTLQLTSFDLVLSAYLDRLQPGHQPCKGVMSCEVPHKVGFCTWAWWSWMELNTCKQMLLFLGTKLLACSRLHSYTVCYCFPFIASCHSLCQSLIRTTSFHRLISHFSKFLTLHNERERLKGIDWKEGKSQREKEWERG